MTKRELAENLADAFEGKMDILHPEHGVSLAHYLKPIIEQALTEWEKIVAKDCFEIAVDVEVQYAPIDPKDACCKCTKSHAKSDGAAIVADKISAKYLKEEE